MKNYTQIYLADQIRLLAQLQVQLGKDFKFTNISNLLISANKEKKRIFSCGNGGSAANASHFITDLVKCASHRNLTPNMFRGICLNTDISLVTALSNDYDYEEIFARQLLSLGEKGDVLFLFSVSGTSPNLLKVARLAQRMEIKIVSFIGDNDTELETLSDYCIRIPSKHYGRTEDAEISLAHLLCYYFVEN